VTIEDLIFNLSKWDDPKAEVKAFNADTGFFESVTGSLYDPIHHDVELHTDDDVERTDNTDDTDDTEARN